MGLCHSVLDVIARRRRTTHLPPARVFNGLRWIARAGALWRMMPNDLPPSVGGLSANQAAGWRRAALPLVDDLRLLLREAKGPPRQPSAAIFDSRTLQSTPESGSHAGYDGAKRRKGSKVHAAVDTLGNLLALLVTPANEQDRAQVGKLARGVQEVTGQTVEIAFVDQGYTGDVPATEAKQHGIQLEVVKLPQAKRGFVLLPRRWVVERSFAWTSRFRRLVRDYECFLPPWLACTWSCLHVSCFINGWPLLVLDPFSRSSH